MNKSEIDSLMSAANLKVGEKVFDLFEYEGTRIEPENHPCFDPNNSKFKHNPDGSVTNTTDDMSYRMNCFSDHELKEKFVNDKDKEAFITANADKFDKIQERGFYESEKEINDCIIYMDIKNETDTSDHGSLTLEINSLLHDEEFADGRGGCSYHFTVEKDGQFGLEKELIHAEYEQKRHSRDGDNAKGDPFNKSKRFQIICVKKFINKDSRDEGVILQIWAKYPDKEEFVKIQEVKDKHDWYRSPPDYKEKEIVKMTRVHPDFKDGEAITWGGPLGMIIKGGGSKSHPHELTYTFYDVKIWRPLYD
jgi:hypothetical protein